MASLPQILLFFAFMNFFSSSSAEISSRKEVRSKETIQENSVQSSRIDPSRVVQLSWQPRVFVYRDLISEEDCDHLISLAQGQKEGTNSVVSDTQGLSTRSLVTLDFKDEVVARIEEKISAWTLLPLENSRSLEVQHYGNEEAKQKYDYFGNQSAWQVSEPLMATVILFLSDVSRGGEISFPESQLKTSRLRSGVWSTNHDKLLRPIKGNAILFFSVRPNASPDKSSRHERNPVLEGEMWCATKFFHIRSVVRETFHLSQTTVTAAMKMKIAHNGLHLVNVKRIQHSWLALLIIMGHVGGAVMFADASDHCQEAFSWI